MALVPMQKINILIHKKDKSKVMSLLMNAGVLHLTDSKGKEDGLEYLGSDEETTELQYKVAELDFSIGFLANYEKKKKGLQAMVDGDTVKVKEENIRDIAKNYSFQEVVDRGKSVEEEMVKLSNEEKAIIANRKLLEPWSHYKAPLSTPAETEYAASLFAVIPLKNWEDFKKDAVSISKMLVLESENIVLDQVYVEIVCEKSLLTEAEGKIVVHKGETIEFPEELEGTVSEEMKKMDKRLEEIEERQSQLVKASKELSKDLKNLRICYDYYNWHLIRKNARKNFVATDSTVVVSGWMPRAGIKELSRDINEMTPHFELIEVEPEEGEDAPVLLENKGFMKPFQSVTGIYGLPLPNELDPTPYLAVFFIVFFGLALTDALYGLIMFALMFSVLRFLKIPKQSQGLIRLLMYAGLVTFFAGALYGGWASMTADQAPAFMTTINEAGETVFKFQKIDAIKDPMSVLILSLVLGFIQVLFGVILNFVHKFRTESRKIAMIEYFPWVFLLTVIGLTIMSWKGIIIPTNLLKPMLYICGFGALMVAFVKPYQFKKPAIWMIPLIPLKLVFDGVLRLYGLVGYLSDVLSYSRLLALGLATSIIGLAVNTIAGMVSGIPFVGFIFVIIVLICGHVFNIGINALGAFIHSGRLQFVEFFTKFLEGGGQVFRPLKKESKFVRSAEE